MSMETLLTLKLVAVLVLLVLSALFSGIETGLTTVNRAFLKQQAGAGDQRATRLINTTRNMDRVLAVMLIGNNLVLVAAAAMVNSILTSLYPEYAAVLTTLILTPALLLFGEILPKSLFLQYRNSLTLTFSGLVTVLTTALGPLARFGTGFAKQVVRLLGLRSGNPSPFVTKEDLRTVLEEEQAGIQFREAERELLANILALGETTLHEIMVPRLEMVWCSRYDTLEFARDLMRSSGHSSLPVYAPEQKDYIGIVHYSDILLASDRAAAVTTIIRPVRFAPSSKRVDRMLVEFQTEKFSLCLVVDEYGDVSGLVTLEDIVEEIIGQIHDEYDVETQYLTLQPDGSLVLDGRLEIYQLNEFLGTHFPESPVETVGGLVMQALQKIPERGEELVLEGLRFRVLSMRGRRVDRLRVELARGEGSRG